MYSYLHYSNENEDDDAVVKMMDGESNEAFRLYPPNLCACDFSFDLDKLRIQSPAEWAATVSVEVTQENPGQVRSPREDLPADSWELLKINTLTKAAYLTPSLKTLQKRVDVTYRESNDPRIKLMRKSVEYSHKEKTIDRNRGDMIRLCVADDIGWRMHPLKNTSTQLLDYVLPEGVLGDSTIGVFLGVSEKREIADSSPNVPTITGVIHYDYKFGPPFEITGTGTEDLSHQAVVPQTVAAGPTSPGPAQLAQPDQSAQLAQPDQPAQLAPQPYESAPGPGSDALDFGQILRDNMLAAYRAIRNDPTLDEPDHIKNLDGEFDAVTSYLSTNWPKGTELADISEQKLFDLGDDFKLEMPTFRYWTLVENALRIAKDSAPAVQQAPAPGPG
jgi:hypothetical protein